MQKLLISLLADIALPSVVKAGVDPEVHKLCLPAVDYIGCVKAQSGNSNQMRITIDRELLFQKVMLAQQIWLM